MSELSEVQQDIQVLVKINKTFTRSITKIGTKGDGHALRSSLDKLQVDFQEMEDLIQKSLKSIKTSKNIARKLQEDVKSIISQFQASSKKRTLSERQNPLRRDTVHQMNPLSSSDLEDMHHERQQQQQQQQQHQEKKFEMITRNRLEVERAIAQEKHNEIKGIQQDVLLTQDLVKDIAVLINEQGEALDEVEAQVEQAGTKIERGVGELHKANDYQRAARKKKCCIIILLLLILAGALIPTILHLNNSSYTVKNRLLFG
jgi:t-SNARE complex subunit (syntaxin)